MITLTSKVARSSRVVPGKTKARLLPTSQVWLWPAGLTLLLWFTGRNEVSGLQCLAAFLLLLFPAWSYHYWQQTGGRGLPLFSAVAAMYWLYFVLHLFWGDRFALDWRRARLVGNAAVTEVMLLVVFGVVFLWLGMRSTVGAWMAPKRFAEIAMRPWSVLYVQGIAIAGTVMSRYQSLASSSGEGGRQIVSIVENTTSLAAVVILLWRAVDGKAGRVEKIVLMVILAVRVLLGVSSGWVGAAAALGMSCAFVYLHKHRKLPIVMLVCVLPYVLFFQAGKEQFRRVFWRGETQASPTEKVEFWVNASLKAWQDAFDDPSGRRLAILLSSSLTRTSLLTQAANVLEQTPAVVPYQYGRLYSYLAVSLVPRLFWPEKPSVNEANRFYQVAYGVTREQDLNGVSIAVGVLTEGYINFGWFGTALVMFLVGLLLDFWNETFLTGSGALAAGIGIAMIPQLVMVEYQLAQYASGLIQNVLLTVVIFLPVMRLRSNAAVKPVRSGAWGMASARP